jgi:3-ketosteroid 9alpha-monooxygenase subunit B
MALKDLIPQAAPRSLAVQVIRREMAASDAVTFTLAVPGKSGAPASYLPGQFITLALPTSSGKTLYRSYSLCGDGSPQKPWEITVKRVPNGRVSNYLIDRVEAGAVLRVSLPQGGFVLPQPLRRDMSLVFIAAGSGITPIRGMIHYLATLPADRRPMVFLHFASSRPEKVLFRQEWERIDPQRTWFRQWHYIGTLGHRLTPQAVLESVKGQTGRTEWYVCGPEPLREGMQTQLTHAGVAPDHIHLEAFVAAPPEMPARAAGKHYALRIQQTGTALNARGNETLLEALERQGYHPDFSCRAGSCGTCKLRLVAGSVDRPGATLTPAERQAGYVLSCVAHPVSDVTLQSAGRGQGVIPTGNGALTRDGLRWLLVGGVALLLMGVWQQTNHSPGSTAQASSGITLPTFGDGNGDDGSGAGNNNGSGGGNGGGVVQQPSNPIVTSGRS